jgi:hypothetical protein
MAALWAPYPRGFGLYPGDVDAGGRAEDIEADASPENATEGATLD